MRFDACVREADETHLRLESELGSGVRRRDEGSCRTVGETGGVPGRHASAGAKRRAERRERLHRRVRAEELVAVGDRPAVVREDGHRHDDLVHHAVVPRLARATLRLDGVGVRGLPRQLREGIVQVLGRLTHDGRRLVDQALGHEPRVEVDVRAHGVVAHVLDAAHEDDVGCAHRDLARARGGRGEGTGAHPVDGEAGHGRREAREQRDVASERETLVADLRGRGEGDVVDALGRELRVASKDLAHGLDRHVVGARLREEAVRRRAAERGADAVDVDHLAKLGHGETILPA